MGSASSLAADTRVVRGPERSSLGAATRIDRAWLPLLVITAAAAALRFALIGHQGYWMDEGITIGVLHKSLGTMLHDLSFRETTPPLYYVLAWFWARVFGYGEAGLRSLSAVIGVATVPVAYAAGAQIVSKRVGLIVAALTACCPLLVWYSQEVRPYSLLVLFSALSLLTFEMARAVPTVKRLILWGAVSGVAIVAHYFAVMLVAPEAVWLLVAHRRRWAAWVGVAIVAGCGAALIPLALQQEKLADWIAGLSLSLRLRQVRLQFVVGFAGFHTVWFLAAAVIVLAVVLLVWRGDAFERQRGLGAAALGAAGLVIAVVIDVAGKHLIDTRNLLEVWLPLAVFVAAGLGARQSGRLGLAGAAVLCVIGIAGVVYTDATPDLQRPDWRPISAAIGAPPANGERVVMILRYGSLFPVTLYQPRMHNLQPGWQGRVSELDVITVSHAPHSGYCWWGAACQLQVTHLSRPPRLPGFSVVQRIQIGRFVLTRLRAQQPEPENFRSVYGAVPRYTLLPKTILYEPSVGPS